jgi:hypothetical protein
LDLNRSTRESLASAGGARVPRPMSPSWRSILSATFPRAWSGSPRRLRDMPPVGKPVRQPGWSKARANGRRYAGASEIYPGSTSIPTSRKLEYKLGRISRTWSVELYRIMPCKSDASSRCPLATSAILW